ncbi:MAG: ATP-binding protein [Chloroflexi bacterium]|nr:ATP-binding protein [Chloroflexota bacterium]
MTGTLLPLVISVLHERLHFRYWTLPRVVRLDTFFIDLSDWKLAFSDRTPCFWVHTPELLGQPVVNLADEIRDAVRQKGWQKETILVLVEGPADELRGRLSTSFTQFLVLGEQQHKEIASAPSPTRVMLDLLLPQMPRARLGPYQTTRPVTGSRFFGRESYLNKMIAHRNQNYVIIGIRRIGKTSLLQEVKRRLDLVDEPNPEQQRRLYIDCSVITSAEELYREIVLRLRKEELKRLLGRNTESLRFQAQMFEYLAGQNGGTITYLLDEIDGLLKHLGGDLSVFDVLRRVSSEDGAARFIIAGFREARRAVSDDKTPFYNFGEPLVLDAMDRTEVKRMVEFPMDQLRVKLQGRDEILQRIYRETAGMPNFVQYYCQTLLENLDRSSQDTLSVAHLQSVYENRNFRDFVIKTFIRNTVPLERAIVFAMVAKNHTRNAESYSQKDIDDELSRRGVNLGFTELDEGCGNLVAAGILQQHGRQYSFSIPLFARMLEENFSVDFVLKKTRDELIAKKVIA